MPGSGFLTHWQLTQEEIDEIISSNPSLRGMLFGYVSEYKLRKHWFANERITNLVKEDDHNHLQKGDLFFTYKGVSISVEVKCLQTHTVRRLGDDAYRGKFQCDASDRRRVLFPDGTSLETTCLRVGEFDLLAVGLFEFGQQWRFAFARNSDLPHSRYKKYTPEQQRYLLATLMDITWPLQPPYEAEPFRLLDIIALEKRTGATADKIMPPVVPPEE